MSFIFWRFFGEKLEILEFCVVFVKKTMFRSFFVHSSLVFFFGEVFAKVSQIPCLSSFIFVDFGGPLRSCLESLENTSVFVLVAS